jgi:hypothetical protein
MLQTRKFLGLTAALGTAFVLLTAAAPAAEPAPCPQAFGSFSAGHWPSACWRPYGPDSPFNKALPANPRVAADSSAIIASLNRYGDHFAGGGTEFAFVSSGRGADYYSQPGDPSVTIRCTNYWGPNTCQGNNGVSVDGITIHIPAGAQPQPDVDAHMTIIDQNAQLEYDFEHATWSADHRTLTVWAGSQIPIGPDQGSGLGTQSTAAHFSTIAGLVRASELAAGSINHALVIDVPCTQGSVWPAQGPWGYPCGQLGRSDAAGQGAVHLGSLLQLNMTDAQIAGSGAPAWEQTLMRAMAHYGMFINDTNASTTIEIQTEADISYTSLGAQPPMANLLRQLGGSYWAPLNRWIVTGPTITVNQLRVIAPCVSAGTCSSPA